MYSTVLLFFIESTFFLSVYSSCRVASVSIRKVFKCRTSNKKDFLNFALSDDLERFKFLLKI